MQILFTKEYKKFNESRVGFHLMICKTVRIMLVLLIVLFLGVRKGLGLSTNLELIAGPCGVVWNLFVSSYGIYRKNFSVMTFYLATTFAALCIISLEIALNEIDKISGFFLIFFGLFMGYFFSISLLLKLPIKTIAALFAILWTHIMLKLYTRGGEKPVVTPIVVSIIFLILLITLTKIEVYDFKTWKSLQATHRQLLHFKQIMHLFPSNIMIWNKSTWENGAPLYLNGEAEKLFEHLKKENSSLTVKELLKTFILDPPQTADSMAAINQMTSQPSKVGKEGSLRAADESLLAILEKKFHSEGFKSLNGFQNKLATLTLQDPFENSIEEQSLSTKNGRQIVEKRIELFYGNIEWWEEEALVLIMNDISKTEKIKELKLLHENKDRMLATVSHELRTPLNGIIGMIDIACNMIRDTRAREFLDIGLNSSKTLLLMINDILDVSQIQHGTLGMNIEIINLDDVIIKVLPIIEFQIKQKGLNLLYNNHCSPGLKVRADAMRLQQILMNLLSNACKFTKQGYVSLTVTQAEEEEIDQNELISKKNLHTYQPSLDSESSELISIPYERSFSLKGGDDSIEGKFIVKVTDTGIGIKQSKLNKLFKLFGKLKNKDNSIGVGLGLAISQNLARKMGSEIEVESEPGVGTSFSFKLSGFIRNKNYENERHSVVGEFMKGNSMPSFTDFNKRSFSVGKKKLNVLIVEDDQVSHIVISQYLKDLLEWESVKAYNGREALDTVKLKAEACAFFDLILMDCNMPVMNGFEATETLRKMIDQGSIPNTRIIALTANASIADKEECLNRGMDEVWTKPLIRKDFTEKMKILFEALQK